jgi:hypothetical protein
MYHADLNDEDDTGYLQTFPGEARDPAQITPGTIAHPRLPPGHLDDYRDLVQRALAS